MQVTGSIRASFCALVCGILCALWVASASAQLQAKPLRQATRIEFDGYSLVSPAGEGWFELMRDERRIVFGKKIASRTHAFIATAIAEEVGEKFATPEEFRAYFNKAPAEAADKRNIVLAHEAGLERGPGPLCARVYTLAEDYGAVYSTGKPLLLETFGLACLHPDKPNVAIVVSYSERGLPAEASVELRDEGEQFIRSLTFGANK